MAGFTFSDDDFRTHLSPADFLASFWPFEQYILYSSLFANHP